MNAKDRKPEEPEEALANFVDRELGTRIDNIVKATGHKDLRPVLKRFFVRYFVIGIAIKGAKDPDEFETQINKTADLLGRRIKEATSRIIDEAKKENIETERQRKEFAKQYEEQMQNQTSLPPLDDPELLDDPEYPELQRMYLETERIIKESDQLDIEFAQTLHETMGHLIKTRNFIASVESHLLQKAFYKFKRWKIIRKLKQAFYRVVLAVIIFGIGYSLVTSTAGKFFLQATFWLYLLFALSAAVIKEYAISPWIRMKRLNQQRKDLLKTYTNFMEADLSYFLLAYMKNERMKKKTAAITATMMQEVRKDFSAE